MLILDDAYILFYIFNSFLLLMSSGLYRSYEEATGSSQANKEIAQMVVEQVKESLY